MGNRKKGYILIIFAAVCWGFSGSCGQYLVNNKNMDSRLLAFLRLILSGIILSTYVLIKKREKLNEILKNKKDTLTLFIYAIFGMTMCQFTYIMAIDYTNAGTATVMQYIGPIFVIVFMSVKNGKLPSPAEVFCVLLALFGIFVLSTHGDIHSLQMSKKGFFWCMMAALGLMFNNVIPADIIKKYDTAVINGVSMLIGGIFLFVIMNPLKYYKPFDMGEILGVLSMVFIGTILAFLLYLKGMAILGPVIGSMLSALEAVSAVIFSFLWLGTKFSHIDIFGFAIIISAVVILGYSDMRKSKQNLKNGCMER